MAYCGSFTTTFLIHQLCLHNKKKDFNMDDKYLYYYPYETISSVLKNKMISTISRRISRNRSFWEK